MNKKNIQILSSIFPSYFAKKFYNRLLHPQIRKNRSHEIATLAKADKKFININNNDIQIYKWGNGDKKILLVHGWEGQAGNYADIVEQLLDNHYTVYAFDGPGHGNSSGGKNIMFEYADTLDKIITKLEIRKIVSHSFGSVVTIYGLNQIPSYKIDRYVLLTMPHSFNNYVSNISNKMGLSEKATQLFIKKLESERNVKIESLDLSKYVQNINVDKALVIHDEKDKVIPISDAEAVVSKWENAELMKISNTGHFKILRTPDVAKILIEFMEN
ncbi:alpha/beta fold hydrolase [Membranihabitans marinus]|uniref:alpha/beta fold hydrolase n=1 Tax=Membranihabitans marinus TaxID=1227546 RepID=UPI001F2200CD|nr:alpha/beta hydrolase [Membranihabitans marinus]